MGRRNRIMLAVLVAAVALGGAGDALAASPVKVSLPALGQADLLATGKVPVSVVARRRLRVRVGATLLVGKRRVGFGRARVVRLAKGRERALALTLTKAGRAELAGCPDARVRVRVLDLRSGRSRRGSRVVGLQPPACARFFSSDAFWNQSLPDDAPLDPDSAAVTDRLVQSVKAAERSDKPPWINTDFYSPPVYTVGPDQPRVAVTLDAHAPDLAAALASVPLPSHAAPSAGSDSELVVWQPSTDTLWEFWGLSREGDGWHARWGGRLDQVSSGPGHFDEPHADWGATATSLPLVGGLMTPRELRTGRIDHALAIAAPEIRANQYALPAQRTDGSEFDAVAVPEGARFRLDPSLDVDSLGLPAPIAAMARAAQRYGIVVRDRATTVTFYAQNRNTMASDPYPEIFGSRTPAQLLERFPWDRLQLTRMDLRRMPEGGRPPLHCLLGGCP